MATYPSRRHNRNRGPYNLRRNMVNTTRAPRSSPEVIVIPDDALEYVETDPWAGFTAQQRLELSILGPQNQEETEQMNLAIAQSLAELENTRQKKRTNQKDDIRKVMDKIKEDPMGQHLMKAKFANLKRSSGFNPDSIRYDKDKDVTGPKTTSRFHKHLQDFLCVICLNMPYDMRYCKACKRYYCNTCLMDETAQNIGCPLRAKGNANSSNGYYPHEILIDRFGRFNIEDSARRDLDNHVDVLCEFGETSDNGPKYMDWTTAERHYIDGQCPNALCADCGLIKSDQSSHQQSQEEEQEQGNKIKCIEDLKEFSVFLMAKHEIEMKEKDKIIEGLQNTIKENKRAHKNLNDIHDNLLKAHNLLLEKTALRDDPVPTRLKDLEKMVKDLSNKLCNTSDAKQSEGNNLTANLMSHPTDSDTRYHSPIVYVNHFELGRRELKGLTRNHRLSDLVRDTKKLWNISAEEENDYCILDLRSRIHHFDDQDFVWGNRLRNVSVFNLVPKSMFKKNKAYELQLKGLEARYTPLVVSADHGFDTTPHQSNRQKNGKDTHRGHHSRQFVPKKDSHDPPDNRRDGPNDRTNRSNRRDRHGNFY